MIGHHALIIRMLQKPGEEKRPGEKIKREKIKRDAFIYLSGKDKEFAQCGTCRLHIPNRKGGRCFWFSDDDKIKDEDSCALYVPGPRIVDNVVPVDAVSPQEAGFIADTKVRCENCTYGGDKCRLYVKLNQELGDIFDLETSISPLGCCNAWVQK